jgi:uncharacterized protein (DUF1697 family)
MYTYVALLRGINVGGRNRLKMKDLASMLTGLGLHNIKTYIQSGNVVFQSNPFDPPALAEDITTTIAENYGFDPSVLILSAANFQQALAGNPFPEADSAPKSVHLYFLASPATDPDLDTLKTYQKENERFLLTDAVFYLHAPDGIGRSKLAERVEKALGVAVTARNWRTAGKIMDLVMELES